MPNPYVLLAALLLCVGSFFYGQHVGKAGEIAKQAEFTAKLVEVQETAQQAAAQEIGKIQIINRTVRQTLEREIQIHPDPAGCVNNPDRMRALNAALTNRPIPAGDSVVPGSEPSN